MVKSNPGVMGKNWLHIRDGSGGEGTNDLTVDRDLGMGYRYDVIIEDAEVTIEATGS